MIRFLSKMIAVDTSKTENLPACAKIITEEAEKEGFAVKVFDAREIARDGLSKPNLLVFLDAGRKQTILLLAHYDVVPPGDGWKADPFKARVIGNRIYGRGAADDKGAVAACLEAMKRLKASGKSGVNVKLLVVCDEEKGGKSGIEYVVKKAGGLRGEAQIVVDGDVIPLVGASGIIFGKIIIKGKQGHAGWAHQAINAINLPFLSDVSKYAEERKKKISVFDAPPFSGVKKVYGRFNITMVHAGEKENVIPGECIAGFDLRLLPEENSRKVAGNFKKYFERVKKKHGVNAALEYTMIQPGYYTEREDELVEKFFEAAGVRKGFFAGLGGNDGRHLRKKGIPTICFGPIRRDERIDTHIHGKNEFALIKDLEFTRDAIIKLCEEWKK